jgi:hypothetical protein
MHKRNYYENVWTVKTQRKPNAHSDVILNEGESVGIVVGGRRLVVSVDEWGNIRSKVQKKVEVWADEEEN